MSLVAPPAFSATLPVPLALTFSFTESVPANVSSVIERLFAVVIPAIAVPLLKLSSGVTLPTANASVSRMKMSPVGVPVNCAAKVSVVVSIRFVLVPMPIVADSTASPASVSPWIWTLPPPKYPYPVDQTLASQGAPLYQQHCAECHADHRFRDGVSSGARVGKVVPIGTIGTDRHRLDSYTQVFALNQYGLYPESPYQFKHFRKTNGYANHPLDGIWLRAPYLHNGSVPSLRDLFKPAADRPTVFYRGYDVYDPVGVGFVSNVAEENGRQYFPIGQEKKAAKFIASTIKRLGF